MNRNSTTIIALSAAWVLGLVVIGSSKPVPGSQPETVLHVRAELVAETSSIRPGRAFGAGLYLLIDRGWHVNWRNPGDAGMAPSLTWHLPPGFTAGPIEWPLPRRIVEGSLASYGYEDEIFLPVKITPPSTLPADTTFTLSVDANWLECSDVCVPGHAELQITASVSSDEPAPAPRYERLYAAVRDRLPRPADPDGFRARLTSSEIVIEGARPLTAPPDTVMFFPFERGLVEHAAPVRWSVDDGRLAVTLARPANRADDPDKIEGVLFVAPGSAAPGGWQVLALAAPVSGGKGLAGPLPIGLVVVVIVAGAAWLARRKRNASK